MAKSLGRSAKPQYNLHVATIVRATRVSSTSATRDATPSLRRRCARAAVKQCPITRRLTSMPSASALNCGKHRLLALRPRCRMDQSSRRVLSATMQRPTQCATQNTHNSPMHLTAHGTRLLRTDMAKTRSVFVAVFRVTALQENALRSAGSARAHAVAEARALRLLPLGCARRDRECTGAISCTREVDIRSDRHRSKRTKAYFILGCYDQCVWVPQGRSLATLGLSVLSEQRGALRVNCVDCLDRTNVGQSLMAHEVFFRQLQALHCTIPGGARPPARTREGGREPGRERGRRAARCGLHTAAQCAPKGRKG